MKDSIMGENSHNLLHYYFNQTNEAIVITELTSLVPLAAKFYDFNDKSCSLLGYTREEMKKLNPITLFFGHIDSEIFRSIQNRFAIEREITVEMELLTKLQTKIPVEANCFLIKMDGKTFIYSSIKKISRRKKEFDQLLSEKEFSHSILDTIQAFVVLLEPDGRIADWNRHCTFHTGYAFEEAAGKYIWDVMLEKEESRNAKDFFSRSVTPFPAFHENNWVAKTGEKMMIRWSNKEIFDQNGQVQYIVCTGIDLTENKLYEEKLKESNEKFKRLVEHNPDGIIIYQNAKLTYMNLEAEKMLGMNCMQAGGSISNLLHPSDQIVAHEALHSLINHEQDVAGPIELTLTRRDGSSISIEAKGISDWNQNDTSVIVVMRDISPRKKAEQEFQHAFNQMQGILSSSVEGLLGIDEHHHVIFVNQAMLSAINMNRSDIIGQSIKPLLLKYTDTASIHSLLEENRTIEVKIGDGRKKRHLELSANPMKNERGQVITFYDQTDRVLLETAKNRYYDAIACGITVQNSDGTIVFANQCASEILGYESSDLLNMSSLNIEWNAKDENGRDLTGQEHPSMTTLLTKKEISHFVMGVYNPIREENRWILIDTRILYADQSQDIEYIIATFQDITEKIELDKMVKSQEKLALAGRMATAVAHEVRNPLTSVLGFLQLMETSDELNKDYLRIMKKDLERIKLVTNEFLSLAKPESMETVKLELKDDILVPVVHILMQDLNDRNITFEFFEEENGPYYVEGKQESLKQVFLNFLTNAMDAIPKEGSIHLILSHFGEHVLITIEDTGIGIDPERLPFLGEPFYSLKEKGTGLGLLICRKILEDHRGHFSIVSSPGEGTKVTIFIPAASQSDSETA
ncbi:PAS domain S-box protein [Metabacillus sp. FJAT-52054]|uniref:histidine kinase n=1 Tax=Metabacillus sediminis TaxID=3117746 RepID=A0ABZ2NLK9_9BACI